MDPIVAAALIAAGGAIITGLLTLYTTRAADKAKREQEENASKLKTIEVQLSGWDHLVEALQADLKRRDVELERRQHIIDEYRRIYGFLDRNDT